MHTNEHKQYWINVDQSSDFEVTEKIFSFILSSNITEKRTKFVSLWELKYVPKQRNRVKCFCVWEIVATVFQAIYTFDCFVFFCVPNFFSCGNMVFENSRSRKFELCNRSWDSSKYMFTCIWYVWDNSRFQLNACFNSVQTSILKRPV